VTKEIVFDFEIDTARLLRAFESADDVGAIIRTHYELDRALSHVLAKFYANPKKLSANRVGPKIERLEALGFGGSRIEALRTIDDIRNAVAHRDQEEVRVQDVAALRTKIDELSSGRFSDEWRFSYRAQSNTLATKYSDMTLRQQFCLLAFLAIAAVVALPHEVDQIRSKSGS
jgi:hypothetical protein